MGQCLSSRKFKGDGQRLGSAPTSTPSSQRRTASEPSTKATGLNTPISQPSSSAYPQDREARAAAAEARLKAASSRGAITGNGKLSKQLEERNKGVEPAQIPDRVVYD